MQYFFKKTLAFLVMVWYNLDSDGEAVHWRLAIIDSEKPQKWHKAKIYYNGSGKAYFRHNGARVYLSEVMRI